MSASYLGCFYRWLINQNTAKEILRSADASLRMTGGRCFCPSEPSPQARVKNLTIAKYPVHPVPSGTGKFGCGYSFPQMNLWASCMPSLSGRLFPSVLHSGLPRCERVAIGYFYRWLINQNTIKEILRSAGAPLRMTGGSLFCVFCGFN